MAFSGYHYFLAVFLEVFFFVVFLVFFATFFTDPPSFFGVKLSNSTSICLLCARAWSLSMFASSHSMLLSISLLNRSVVKIEEPLDILFRFVIRAYLCLECFFWDHLQNPRLAVNRAMKPIEKIARHGRGRY